MNFNSDPKLKVLYLCQGARDRENSVLLGLQALSSLVVRAVFRADSNSGYYGKGFSVIEKVFERLQMPIDCSNFNKRARREFIKFNPDVVFVIKGTRIFPSTLKFFKKNKPSIKMVNYTQDDMMGLHNQSFYWRRSLKMWDCLFTTKSYNANKDELPSLGVKRVVFVDNAYCEIFHNPMHAYSEKVRDVIFIGSAEHERAQSLWYLANSGVGIDVFGSMWDKPEFQIYRNHNLRFYNKELRGHDYSTAISSAKISLCFLRKINRDLQTVRSTEIPACGSVMVAEWSPEHQYLFENNYEAVYFKSDEELVQKVKMLLSDPSKIKQISEQGRKRCLSSGYSYRERLEKMINIIREL